MRHARLKHSARLQRTLKALREAGGEISTLELIRKARICAVSAAIAELRANGADITCRKTTQDGRPVFFYTLVKLPEPPHAPSETD